MAIEENSPQEPINKGLESAGAQAFETNNILAKAGSFIWHLAQMILVMEAGMMVYMRLIRPLLTTTAFSDTLSRHPLISYWLMVISMALPMIALMRLLHKSTWGYSLGMTIGMVAPLAALTVLVLCNLVSIHILFAISDPLMFMAMAVFMIVRPHTHAHASCQPACHMV
ncbi:MAG: hypothetical protein P4L50_30120 [Anaerolineaceae bacterium]|nr:hypothetical protein [Anaerolineaceae bacterium]